MGKDQDKPERETVQFRKDVIAAAMKITKRHLTEPKRSLDYEDTDPNYDLESDYVSLLYEFEWFKPGWTRQKKMEKHMELIMCKILRKE